jgi:CheY-like chemotaxis protein
LAKDQEIELVLTDMQMPSMDGMEFAENVKQLYPSMPIILLSSIGQEFSKMNSGLFSSVLNKPVRQHVLSKHILNVLQPQSNVGASATKDKQQLPSDFAKKHPLEILIAEDNVVNQKVIIHILNKLGYQPTLAEDGKIAIEEAGKRQYDIILMDMQMPEMDGVQATKFIRQNMKVQPLIIALTANTMQSHQEECLQAGMDDFVSKPVRLQELTAKLEKWSIAKAVAY